MIEAKGTKEAAVNPTAERDRYAQRSSDQRLTIPLALGALLVGVASYLKSVVPVSGAVQSEEKTATTPQTNEEAPTEVGDLHAAEVVEPSPAGAFELVDSPAFDYSDIGGAAYTLPIGQVVRFRPPAAIERPTTPNAASGAVVQFPSNKVASQFPDKAGSNSAPADAGDPKMPTRRDLAPQDERNRAPRVSGTTTLNDVFGCSAVLISIADLLRNASDPDGDVLGIRNVTVSSGTLTAVAEGWLYTPEPGVMGDVILTYQVTDGEFAVQQMASFAVARPPPIVGTDGDDNLVGTACADDIDGLDGNNNIDGRGGSDLITTGSGDDHIVGGAGNDVIFSGEGADIVFAGVGDDIIHGGSGNDRLFGGSGNDLLFGEAGADIIEGDVGNDTLLDGDGNDTVRGGPGQDIVVVAMDQDDDTYDGGTDIDTLNIADAALTVVVDLQAGEASGEEIGNNTITSFERVIAGSGDDCLSGSSANEALYGGSGNDVLCGEGGADNLEGGAGNDQVIASLDAQNDTYDGGEGVDTLDLSFATMRVEVDLTKGQASSQEIGLDTIRDFEKVIGGQGDDLFIIGEQSTIIKGGGGHNTFVFNAIIASTDMPGAIHEILDFMVGDNIRIKEFEFFREEAPGDNFQQRYGGDTPNEGPIRVRHDRVADLERTYVEADTNADDNYDISIALHGNFAIGLNVHGV